MHNPVASQASSTQSFPPAASESQHPSASDIRAKTVSEPLSQPTPSMAVGASPTATAAKNHPVTCNESTSSSAQHCNINVALSTLPGCPQSTNGASTAPPKVSKGGDEAVDLPRTAGPSAGTEGQTDAKERAQSKPSSRSNEGQSSRNRERDRAYPDWSRDRERHYRDRSHERESDGDRHRYRRDYRDHHYHRSYRDRSPHSRSHRDWESERRRDRTLHHHRERDHDRYHHYHRHRSREDWGRERRGHGYSYREGSHGRWKQRDESREARAMKDKSNGREKDYYPSKEEASSPAMLPESSAKSKGSPPRARPCAFESVHNGEGENHKRVADHLSKERDQSSEARHSKKHKKSKKKKKSKDKERHRESG